ncbi:MAG: SDR family NAD(P)-dependent oxidoreductase [Pseudomonadota bacterium]|nr:SDR family NAD(P)-dependent oxidoreductase [Pseudomonadota bacterium]
MKKVALITGGSSGLGLEMARQLSAQDHDLILLARDADRLAWAKGSIEQDNRQCRVHTIACDVSDEAAITAAFGRIKREVEGIDFLIVNAGIATIDLLSDYESLSEVTRNLRINLLGAVSSTYMGIPLLRPGAHVLFVSSGFGLVGAPGYSLYAAAKGGLNNFADAMRRELLPRGMQVHLACPGDIDTPMYAGELAHMPAWIRDKMGRSKPMKVDVAARHILKMCFRGRFRIDLSGDVMLLVFLQKLLPHRLSTLVLDRMLPVPPV